MMDITFIGGGNMATAIIGGLCRLPDTHIRVVEPGADKRAMLAERFGVTPLEEPPAAWSADCIVVLAVKPQQLKAVCATLAPRLQGALVVSIAAGVDVATLSRWLGGCERIVRVMPNTPAMVGEGMASVSPNVNVTEAETADVVAIFSSFGKAVVTDEKLIDAVCGLSGSGPAYVYMFIEALADGAVREGMPRQMAYTFAAQTVLGAAKMVLETGRHPGALKDDVCSPGGTTIEAVRTLEESSFRAATMNAVIASAEKNKSL